MGIELTVKMFLLLILFCNEKFPPLAFENKNNPKIQLFTCDFITFNLFSLFLTGPTSTMS